MTKAIIYGGAFNPPTLAHYAILQSCFNFAKQARAEVWVLPSGERSDKSIGLTINHRIKLINALLADVKKDGVEYKIIDIELRDKAHTDTYITHKRLQKQLPNYEQVWVFGSDSINTMKQWGNGDWLYHNLKMLITKRPGSDLNQLPPNAKILQYKSRNTSSTQVREFLKNNKPVHHLVPPTTHKLLISDMLPGYN